MFGGYYHFYPGDYLRDTSGLSLIEHGAYNLLLHHYYSLDGCVPDEKPRLYRLCGATAQEEQVAVEYVLKIYFPSINGKLSNRRADLELAARHRFLEEQSRKGRLGGRPRKNPNESRGKAGGKAERKPNESPPSPSPSPSLEGSTPFAPTPEKDNGSGSKPKAWANLISWNRDKGCFEGITPEIVEKWEKAYPAVDLNSQLNRADEWLKANPTKQKKNYYRFVINWLARAQERGGR
jgi:uncharacterized protein YdaU (DUF1376 family)